MPIIDCKQRPSQGGKDIQFVIRPLDGSQRGADAFYFFTLMEGSGSHQQVGDAAGVQCPDIGPGDVSIEGDEAPEEEGDVAGFDGDSPARVLWILHLPWLLIEKPADKSGRCIWKGRLKRLVSDLAGPDAGFRDGEGNPPPEDPCQLR